MDESRRKLIGQCRQKLVQARQDLVLGLKSSSESLTAEVVGDEGDMAQVLEGQHTSLMQREKLMNRLREIDQALQRIDDGRYGECEETEEPIEAERLLAIPWTRVSSEGAEIRERQRRRHSGYGT